MSIGNVGSLILPNGASAPGIWSAREVAAFQAKGRWPGDFPKTLSGLTLWYAAHRITGLNDGDAVTTWSDLSGNGYDVTQGTAANRPLYKTNIFNGLPALLFDGSNDSLENTTVNPFTAGAARTVFVVAKQLSDTGGIFVCFRRTATVWCYHNALNSGTYIVFTDGVNSSSNTRTYGTRPLQDGPGVYTIRAPGGGGTHKVRANGNNLTLTAGSTPASESGSTGFFVGRREGSNGFMNGYIAEILGYNSELSDADCLKVERYLAAKYWQLMA